MYKLLASALLSVAATHAVADTDYGSFNHGDASDIEQIAYDLNMSTDFAKTLHPETIRMLRVLMAVPSIYTTPDVKSEPIVRPGEIYDATWMDIRGKRIWLGDRGRDTHDGKSGSVVTMDLDGNNLKREIGFNRLAPLRDIAFAPKSFGKNGDKLIAFSQPEAGFAGSLKDHVVTVVNANGKDKKLCTLPKGSSRGTEMVAGPEGSAFEGALYVGIASSKSIVKISANGSCSTFASNLPGYTMGLGFTSDGKHMLVGLKGTAKPWVDDRMNKGTVVKVNSKGKITGKPVATGLEMPMSFDYAPKQWGPYAGQLFIVDGGAWQDRGPRGNVLKPDAVIYRIDDNGDKVLFASGFANAMDIKFNKKNLYVADPQGDYYGGVFITGEEFADLQPGREVPDSIIYKLSYTGK